MAGLEPEKTNEFLLALIKVATSGMDFEEAGRKFAGVEDRPVEQQPKMEFPVKKDTKEKKKPKEEPKEDHKKKEEKAKKEQEEAHKRMEEEKRREAEDRKRAEKEHRERERVEREQQRETQQKEVANEGGKNPKLERPTTAGRAPPKKKDAVEELSENTAAMPIGVILDNQDQEDSTDNKQENEQTNLTGVNMNQLNAEQHG